MKVLIADDERHIRNGLKAGLDWEKLKIDRVLMAADGQEALTVCRRENPEIIITDIRMPGLSGLELGKIATESCGAKKVLIMSGYSDFSYAKSAIQIGAVDYLLKPINLDELEGIIREIVSMIPEEEEKDELFSRNVLKDIVLGNIKPGDVSGKVVEKYSDIGEICCVVLRGDKVYAGAETGKVIEALSPLAETLQDDNLSLLVSHDNEFIFMWKARDYQERNMRRGMLRSVLSAGCGKIPWSAGVSLGGGFAEIHTLYEQAKKALKYRLSMEKDRLIFYEDIFHDGSVRAVKFSWKDIRDKIENLHQDSVSQTISDSFEEFRSNRCTDRSKVQEFCITFKNLLLHILEDKGIEIEKLLEKNAALFESQLDYDQLSSYERWLQDCCYLILKGLTEVGGKNHSAAVRKALVYINESYGRDITLSEVAENVEKSTNYFCYIFKKDVGMSFNEYLNSVRIGRAKELLKKSDHRVYEISEMVGYHDYTYFTKVFKKICGCSPREYKDWNEEP